MTRSLSLNDDGDVVVVVVTTAIIEMISAASLYGTHSLVRSSQGIEVWKQCECMQGTAGTCVEKATTASLTEVRPRLEKCRRWLGSRKSFQRGRISLTISDNLTPCK